MGKKDAPDAPDFTGAAIQQGQASKDIARRQTFANRPDQFTPWGSSTWENSRVIDPATGKPVTQWQQNISLDPTQQRALDSQMQVQEGRSALAQSLIGRAGGELSAAVDWNGMPKPAAAPDVPDFYGQNLPSMGRLPNPSPTQPQLPEGAQSYKDLQPWAQGPSAQGPGSLPDRGNVPDGAMGDLGTTGQQVTGGAYSPESVQRSIDTSSAQGIDAGGGYQDRFAQQQFERNMSLLGPQQERAMESMDVQLRNRGLTPGSEAYDTAIRDLRNQQSEARGRISADAVRYGGQEQQAQFGRELQTRQQQVGETQFAGNFANQASGQAFNQSLAAGGQQFSEGVQSSQLAEQLRAARAGEQGQQFQQQLQSTAMTDAQRGQALAEGQQFYSQGQQSAQQGNALRGQQFGEMQTLQQQQAAVQSAQFQRDLSLSRYQDTQREQLMREQLQFGQQGFGQQMQQASYQNTLRQQAISEEAQRRGMSINEMNALLSGQQVATPNMPSFMGASAGQAPQLLAAAQARGNFDQQSYQTGAGMFNAFLGAAGTAAASG